MDEIYTNQPAEAQPVAEAPVVEQPVAEAPVVEQPAPQPVNFAAREPLPVFPTPAPTYSTPEPVCQNPTPVYQNPTPVYQNPAPIYQNPAPNYTNPVSSNANPIPPQNYFVQPQSQCPINYNDYVESAFSKALACCIMCVFPVASIIGIVMGSKAKGLLRKATQLVTQFGGTIGGKGKAADIMSKIGFIVSIVFTAIYGLLFTVFGMG